MPILQAIALALAVIAGGSTILLAVYVVFRSKTAEVIRGERDAWQEKCERVDKELKQCKEKSHAKDIVITDLQAKTDLSEITKVQVAILANQTDGLARAAGINNTLTQLLITMKAMEDRLNRGLILGGGQ